MAINAAMTKLSTEALTRAVTKSENLGTPQPGGSSFKDVLTKMDAGTDFAGRMGMSSGAVEPNGSMQALSAQGVNFAPDAAVQASNGPGMSGKVVNLLSEVNKGQMQMDSMVNQVLHSDKKFSNQELLAIQAHVYHYAQMAELTVKVAEHGTTSVKQVLNTQVQ